MSKTKRYTPYRTIEIYEVHGITDKTDQEIIDFCDRCAFGGRVIRHNEDTATVEVDID